MKISHERQSCLIKEIYYPDIVGRRCIHGVAFLCWFLMIVLGTTLIGAGAANFETTYSFCSDS